MSKKIKAIFYAYSNNALDHLAPYVFLCNEKKIDCVVIYGEDFIKHKLKPKQNLEKIFFKNNIKTFDISQIKLKGFVYNFYTLLWLLTKVLDENSLVPIFLRMKLKGLCNKIYNCLDGHMIANQLISKFYNDDEKVFVFIDEWSEKKKYKIHFYPDLKIGQKSLQLAMTFITSTKPLKLKMIIYLKI